MSPAAGSPGRVRAEPHQNQAGVQISILNICSFILSIRQKVEAEERWGQYWVKQSDELELDLPRFCCVPLETHDDPDFTHFV